MIIRTRHTFNAKPEILWPLLFNSKMDERQPCYLLCGLPKPLECRLANNEGGVGETRECVSDKGIIQQRIKEWIPNEKLSFELEQTNIYFGPCVESIIEQFDIKPITNSQSQIVRTTRFKVKDGLRPLVTIPMFIGLKAIHRYVFRNWKRIADADH